MGEGGKDMVSKRLKVVSGGGVKRSDLNMRVDEGSHVHSKILVT